MKKIVRAVIVGTLWIATALIALWYGNSHANNAFANWELGQIRNDLEIWNLTDKANAEARRRIAIGVLGKLAIVRFVNPRVSDLKGTALEALCLLSETEGDSILLASTDFLTPGDQSARVALEYVVSLETEVRTELNRLQETLGGMGCSITP